MDTKELETRKAYNLYGNFLVQAAFWIKDIDPNFDLTEYGSEEHYERWKKIYSGDWRALLRVIFK